MTRLTNRRPLGVPLPARAWPAQSDAWGEGLGGDHLRPRLEDHPFTTTPRRRRIPAGGGRSRCRPSPSPPRNDPFGFAAGFTGEPGPGRTPAPQGEVALVVPTAAWRPQPSRGSPASSLRLGLKKVCQLVDG